jgi:uncharacterized Zn-finger protein
MTEDQLAADYDVYPRFRNDIAVSEIRIGAKEFKCIGVSPPHDHPHVYIDMANQDTILCPYCGTRFRFDRQLGTFEADPPDCLYPFDWNANAPMGNRGNPFRGGLQGSRTAYNRTEQVENAACVSPPSYSRHSEASERRVMTSEFQKHFRRRSPA